MSANPKPDLQQVKTIFETWRAGRVGKERLPEHLWASAVALLDHYPFSVVCRELRLKPDYLRKRMGTARQQMQPTAKRDFLSLTAGQLIDIPISAKTKQISAATTECRIVIEHSDGSRLTLTMPADWTRIEALCGSFLRG